MKRHAGGLLAYRGLHSSRMCNPEPRLRFMVPRSDSAFIMYCTVDFDMFSCLAIWPRLHPKR